MEISLQSTGSRYVLFVATHAIPDEHREAFQAFVRLEERAAAKFVEAVAASAPSLLISALAGQVAPTSGMQKEQAQQFLLMLGSMSRSRAASEKTIDAFLKAVRQNALSDGVLSADDVDSHWPKAAKHLATALGSKAVQISSKALAVMTANERMLCTARVVSDLRPIFGDNLDPAACVILHQLKIAFHEQGDYEDISETFIAVDHEHLVKLQRAIERALKKHEKLKAMAAAMKLPVLSSEE